MENLAAVLDQQGSVIGVVSEPKNVKSIEVAGAFTIHGDPVNVRTYKLSRSKRNLKKTEEMYFTPSENGHYYFD